MQEARKKLPLTRAELEARKRRYKNAPRYIDKPLMGQEFAARIGVTPDTVKRWEKSGVVGDDYAPAVSKALGIPLEEIRRERRQEDLRVLRVRLEEVAASAVTVKELDQAVELLARDLAKYVAATQFLANGKTQEALRVLSGVATQADAATPP